MEVKNMNWSIDRIEKDIAILENIITGEKKEVPTLELPFSIKEGSILTENNNTYTLNLSEEEKRRQEISLRFKHLRSKN